MQPAIIDNLEDELSEKGILPCKPLAGKHL